MLELSSLIAPLKQFSWLCRCFAPVAPGGIGTFSEVIYDWPKAVLNNNWTVIGMSWHTIDNSKFWEVFTPFLISSRPIQPFTDIRAQLLAMIPTSKYISFKTQITQVTEAQSVPKPVHHPL